MLRMLGTTLREQQRANGQIPRGTGHGAADVFYMHQQSDKDKNGKGDMADEDKPEEQVGNTRIGQEISRRRFGEYGQPVQPLGRAYSDELTQGVPHQPVADQTAGKNQHQGRKARHPGKPASTTIAAQDKLTEDV